MRKERPDNRQQSGAGGTKCGGSRAYRSDGSRHRRPLPTPENTRQKGESDVPTQLQEPPDDVRHHFVLLLERNQLRAALHPCAGRLLLRRRRPQAEREIDRRRLLDPVSHKLSRHERETTPTFCRLNSSSTTA
ncbi:hypothetical protein OF83DRAFT_813326 [Amylostereum chailletii]|nr:hypothetical protein OF83DRAFT_813326 [Amylostereum chailletii]